MWKKKHKHEENTLEMENIAVMGLQKERKWLELA